MSSIRCRDGKPRRGRDKCPRWATRPIGPLFRFPPASTNYRHGKKQSINKSCYCPGYLLSGVNISIGCVSGIITERGRLMGEAAAMACQSRLWLAPAEGRMGRRSPPCQTMDVGIWADWQRCGAEVEILVRKAHHVCVLCSLSHSCVHRSPPARSPGSVDLLLGGCTWQRRDICVCIVGWNHREDRRAAAGSQGCLCRAITPNSSDGWQIRHGQYRVRFVPHPLGGLPARKTA